MPSHPERYLLAALAFAVPAVWTGLGATTAVACVLLAGATYAAGGSGLAWVRSRVEELTVRPPVRSASARTPPSRVDEPSEGAMSRYGW